MVVEEAAEILEAHALAGLPPSVEQFLQIGGRVIDMSAAFISDHESAALGSFP